MSSFVLLSVECDSSFQNLLTSFLHHSLSNICSSVGIKVSLFEALVPYPLSKLVLILCVVVFLTMASWSRDLLNTLPDAIPIGVMESSILPYLDIMPKSINIDGSLSLKTPLLLDFNSFCFFFSANAASFCCCNLCCQVYSACFHTPYNMPVSLVSSFVVFVPAI